MFKVLLSSAAVIVIFVFAMVASAAFAAPGITTHNCTNAITSAHLQDKIDNADEGDVIEVSGDCVGADYVIAGDSLTLRGVGGATITGTGAAAAITITHDHATVEGWALIDGGIDHGIVVRASGSALVHDISVIAGEDGIQVIQSASVEVSNVSIDANDDGIFAASNGSALISDTDISGNPDDGVVAAGGGQVTLAGGNTINNNGDFGVIVAAGQAAFNGANTVEGNRVDLDCRQFARVFITQSIKSSSRDLSSRDCVVSEQFGAPVFENHPQNLVDCTPAGTVNDDSITKVLANGVTDVTVRGLCDEHLAITTSNVTITGENLDGGGNPVDGIQTNFAGNAIQIRGAQNATLNNLKITGGRNTISLFAGSTAWLNNTDLSAGGAASIGRYGVFVGDNSWLNMRDSTVLGGNGGGILALRNGTMRIFNSDVSGGATNKFALTLNNSVAYLYGVDLTGSLGAHFNSRTAFFDTFLGIFYGDSVIDSTIGPGQCSRYSNISAFPANIVEDTSATAFLNTDFSAFAECQVTIQ